MKNKARNNRKELKKKLSLLLLVYLEGLNEKKKKKVQKYLQEKVGSIVDYYFNQFKRKGRKSIVLPMAEKKENVNTLNNPESGLQDKILTPATAYTT
jgi:hypothetical protein